MASLGNISGLLKAAKEADNDVMTLEVLPDGGIAITFREGLREAYMQGDPIFTDSRPAIADKDKTGVGTKNLDDQKLEQTYNNSPVGAENPNAQTLEQLLDKATDSQKIEIGADAAFESTVTDTADIIHLKHVETGKVAGGVETEFTPEALAGVISQLETSYQQKTPQNHALDIPIQVQDLQMLDPRNIQTIDSNIQSKEVTEFVTPDAVITLTGNPPVMQVKVDNKADLEKVQAQLNALAKTNSFGPNSEILVKEAMQKLSSHPEFAQQENRVLVVGDINKPVPQINKPTEYNGITIGQQAQIRSSR
jgi:translation elongation factor EF-1alpha